MTKVQVQWCERQTQSPAVTLTTDRSHAALRRLSPRDRRRVLERLADLDQLDGLVRELPYGRRWAA